MQSHSLTLTASHVIRLYLWDKLRKYMGDTWKPIQPNGSQGIPIIPAQDQPETQTTNSPYMVYVYDTHPASDVFVMQHESLSLRVFSQSPATLAATTKLCYRLFSRWDITAREINDWLVAPDGLAQYAVGNEQYDQWLDEARAIKFLTVQFMRGQGTQPADDEGGRVDAIITIDMDFVETGGWELDPHLGMFTDNSGMP